MLRGKVCVGGACFIASLYVVPGWARRCTACGCLFYRESVRGSLICLGGAWAGRLRRRYSPCHAAGTSLAALPAVLPAVLWGAAHDSRPASYPTNVACNSPRHRVSPRNRIVGITTFVDTVESSPNRIACETAPSASCLRSSPRTWTRHFAPGSAIAGAGP